MGACATQRCEAGCPGSSTCTVLSPDVYKDETGVSIACLCDPYVPHCLDLAFLFLALSRTRALFRYDRETVIGCEPASQCRFISWEGMGYDLAEGPDAVCKRNGPPVGSCARSSALLPWY
jgi:hypothetical protein